MNTAVASFEQQDPEAVLDRHAFRRTSGVPTVSVLVGPVCAGWRVWRCWASSRGRSVIVAHGNEFPCIEWVQSIAEAIDLPQVAIRCLAYRAGRDPGEFAAAWRVKTLADRDRLREALEPEADDDLLREMALLAARENSPTTVATALCRLGEKIVPAIVRLVPSAAWPGVLFLIGRDEDLFSIDDAAARWAMRTPAVPVAVVVSRSVRHVSGLETRLFASFECFRFLL